MRVLTKSIAVSMLLAGLCSQVAMVQAATPNLAGKRVFYVTRLDEVPGASESQRKVQQQGLSADRTVAAYLKQLGCTVSFFDQTVSPSKAEGFDLVVLSSVVQSREMADTGFRNVAVPLLTWENDLMDSLRLTGRRKGVDYGEVEKEHYIRIINAPHPLAGGLRDGKTYVYPRDVMMGWGVPARAASVIATLPGEPDKAVVFGYEKGATMDYDFVAPARRVALFLDNDTFSNLSPDGLALFDAAVDWSMRTP
ncbi:hypothetical protein FHY12_000215 [Xanthomonas arboricola]|nr:hypothetical protein [Xanthomonas euroxanthea]MBB3814769.1 hypothetical protein [Xanthomonas euroxanthea]NIK07731.1 hypothetical protein [Xanthomonas euroxanthea]NIK37930.1 hypothetical protein [Xanthomonas euroxanthea]